MIVYVLVLLGSAVYVAAAPAAGTCMCVTANSVNVRDAGTIYVLKKHVNLVKKNLFRTYFISVWTLVNRILVS